MQKCLVLDIETSLMEVYVFDIKDQYITPSQIKKDWDVMAWSAKWLDTPAKDIIYYDRRKDKGDRRILTILWKLLDEADILITQNGKDFDSRKLNARFMLLGMKPPSPYRHLDTYLIARASGKFTSNKLEYLTEHLNVKYKKLSHSKYPGKSLWIECENGNMDAWEEMKKYNIHDVLSTEELYNILKAWAPQNAPKPYVVATACRTCGGKTQKRGMMWKSKTQVQRVQCTACGAWDIAPLVKKEAA